MNRTVIQAGISMGPGKQESMWFCLLPVLWKENVCPCFKVSKRSKGQFWKQSACHRMLKNCKLHPCSHTPLRVHDYYSLSEWHCEAVPQDLTSTIACHSLVKIPKCCNIKLGLQAPFLPQLWDPSVLLPIIQLLGIWLILNHTVNGRNPKQTPGIYKTL